MRVLNAVRAPAWKPVPMLQPSWRPALARQMGQLPSSGAPSINWKNFGQTIVAGSAGVGAFYLSPILPDPVKTITFVGGIGLLGYAAYSLLGGGAAASSAEEPPSTPVGVLTDQEISRISGKFVSPTNGSSSGFNWFSDTYPVTVLVTNKNPISKPLTFQLAARESPRMMFFIPFGTSDEYVADIKTVTVAAGSTQRVDFNPSVKTSRLFSGKQVMDLTLRLVAESNKQIDLDSIEFSLI